jgi:RNA polymerase sigma-70 factor (ECF subfamily)
MSLALLAPIAPRRSATRPSRTFPRLYSDERPQQREESIDAEGSALLSAFEAIRPKLLNSLRGMFGNSDEAQDAVQTAFLRCWQARHEFGELHNPRAWIWRVSLNAGRDLRDRVWRRRSQPMTAKDMEVRSREESPAAIAARREELELLDEALASLRPEEREVFQLRQEQGLTYQEIARHHGIPSGTGKTRMRAALRKLRQQLDQNL